MKKYKELSYLDFLTDVLKLELTYEQKELVKLFEENKQEDTQAIADEVLEEVEKMITEGLNVLDKKSYYGLFGNYGLYGDGNNRLR